MFYYIGYFGTGNSLYILKTKEIIDVTKFSTRNTTGFSGNTKKKLRPFLNPKEHDYLVTNLETENTWKMKRSDSNFYVLLENIPLNFEAHLDDYLCDQEEDSEEHELKQITGKSIIYNIEHPVKDRVFGADVHVTNNIGEADRIASEYVKEKYDYPDLIIGNNIPKIKLDKEFNYVGKINFVPFPKRDNGDIGK